MGIEVGEASASDGMRGSPVLHRHGDRRFYTGMGIAVALVVFVGFARTYYLSHWFASPPRMPAMDGLLHVHAAVFTLWILLGAVQPALIAGGRRKLHRSLGWCAALLAVPVWLLGNLASARAMLVGYKGLGDPFAFYTITFFSMQAFAIIATLAILARNNPETHKRLMLLSSAAILEAAFGRFPIPINQANAPLFFYVPPDLIILAGILYDRASRGRVHGVWLWGGGALFASQLFRIAIMHAPAWLAFAHGVAYLVGAPR